MIICLAQFASLPRCRAQAPAGASVSGANLTADMLATKFDSEIPYQETDIVATSFQVGSGADNYELLIDGEVFIQNNGSETAKIDIALVSGPPLCGVTRGTPPFGNGRVITVTVPAGRIVFVPISIVDTVSKATAGSARLQFRHATTELIVKKNSYLDVIMVPAPVSKVTVTPSQGVQNCP